MPLRPLHTTPATSREESVRQWQFHAPSIPIILNPRANTNNQKLQHPTAHISKAKDTGLLESYGRLRLSP